MQNVSIFRTTNSQVFAKFCKVCRAVYWIHSWLGKRDRAFVTVASVPFRHSSERSFSEQNQKKKRNQQFAMTQVILVTKPSIVFLDSTM